MIYAWGLYIAQIYSFVFMGLKKKKLEKRQIEKQSQIIKNDLALCCSKKYKNYLEGRKIISKH